MTERLPPGADPREVAEERLAAARRRGEIDNLAWHGRPLDLSDAGDPDWWVRRKLRDEQVALPPALQLRRDRDELLATLHTLRGEGVARTALEALDGRIRYAASHVIAGPPSTLLPLDVEALVEQWRATRPPPTTLAPAPPATVPRLRRALRWLRRGSGRAS